MDEKKAKQRSVTYLSDAHLFWAGYGEARTRETLRNIFKACENHDIVVLNGDIFELPFSDLGFAKTVARAVSVLQLTLKLFPNTQINYTIGNHDCDPVFVYALEKLAHDKKNYPNFQVTRDHLVLGNNVSSHGDLPDEMAREHKVPFYEYKGIPIPAQFSLHRLAKRKLPWDLQELPQQIQEKGDQDVHRRIELGPWSKGIADYFKHFEPALYKQADHFILGHTHRHSCTPEAEGQEMQNYVSHDGKKFYNSGVAFDTNQYRPVEFAVSEEVYQEYCARPRPEPVLDKKHADKRARQSVEKVEEKIQERSKQLEKLLKVPDHQVDSIFYINRVGDISDLYHLTSTQLKRG